MCERGGEGHESRGEPGGPPPSPRLRPGRPAGPPRVSGVPSSSGASSAPSHETQGPPQAALDLAHPVMATPCPPAPASRKLVHLPRVPQARPRIPPHGPARLPPGGGRPSAALSPAAATPVHPPPDSSRRYESATASPGSPPPQERVPREGSSRRRGKPRLPPPLPTEAPTPCPPDGPARGPGRPAARRGRATPWAVPRGVTRAEGGGGGTDAPPSKHEAERPLGPPPTGSLSAANPLPARLPLRALAPAAARRGAPRAGGTEARPRGPRTRGHRRSRCPDSAATGRTSSRLHDRLALRLLRPAGPSSLTDRDQVGACRPVV